MYTVVTVCGSIPGLDTLKPVPAPGPAPPSGVLRYKRDAEVYLEHSGVPYTIVRPGRLTDGPYTSYDLNTLLQVGVTAVSYVNQER